MCSSPIPRRFHPKNPKQSICLSCYRTVTAVDSMTLEEANAFHALYCQGRPRFKNRILQFPPKQKAR
jgi:hypothetical protein